MKTSELTGPALDWAVAKCDGVYFENLREFEDYALNYCTDWEHGGPIIEREIAKIERFSDALWEATAYTKNAQDIVQDGPTPLVAAMRCYVASKLGDEVDVPRELLCEQ
jgi:hypothetical protein